MKPIRLVAKYYFLPWFPKTTRRILGQDWNKKMVDQNVANLVINMAGDVNVVMINIRGKYEFEI